MELKKPIISKCYEKNEFQPVVIRALASGQMIVTGQGSQAFGFNIDHHVAMSKTCGPGALPLMGSQAGRALKELEKEAYEDGDK